MVLAARAALVVLLLAPAAPVAAGGLATSLQQAASRCFQGPSPARCDDVWSLSAALKKQADSNDQLHCYTSVLTLEALVAMAERGQEEASREQAALEGLTRDCP